MPTIDEIKKVRGPRAKRVKAFPRRELYRACLPYLPEGMDYMTWKGLVRVIHEELVEDLLAGKVVKLPHRMGSLSIRRKDRKVKMGEDGKPRVNTPIDWGATVRLWAEDADARARKTLLRHESRHVYTVLWTKDNISYLSENRITFRVARPVKLRIKERLKDDDIDCLAM